MIKQLEIMLENQNKLSENNANLLSEKKIL